MPTYDRAVPATITHIGVGAFARAHLGVYADDLLESGWPAAIRGVSLRTRRVESQLTPQDGLYTVTEREPGSASTVRVRGAITSVANGATAAIASIADPATEVVTLTVTEKGYELDPADAEAQRSPVSAPAVLAHGLARRGIDHPPPVIVSLDNLVDNGEVLRRAVLQVVEQIEPKLATWVDANVAFPSSVVDRLVPRRRLETSNGRQPRSGCRTSGR